MLISNLIKILVKAQEKFGDISVALQDTDTDGMIYHIDNEYAYSINEKKNEEAFILQPAVNLPYTELTNQDDASIVVLNSDLTVEY